ncbi:leucine-rich repeat receptor protein kinase EXS [Dorcoceras hygrometricum]|uniref:Leucine-rich repeat receptor protein kinase EXS n=1 Tax=Dorcoceras hygrometricum TaxID=472368 RepID=A0A2Z7AE97_9LAMI|nr:leucine-rich repeat receptor protein kinase EXS [Dorcoceras hygrometricum]
MDPTLQGVLAAIGGFFFVSLMIVTISMICGENKHKRSDSPAGSWDPSKHQTETNFGLSSISVGESASFDPSLNLNRISMQALIDATRNFSRDLIVGDGSFGLVYKARLSSSQVVAVKRLSTDAFQGLREFRAEMETLGKIRHPNIIKLLGYCVAGSERVLIYEFMENGSLDQWLYDTLEGESGEVELRSRLSWQTRIKIVGSLAKGLCYMHNWTTPIIHRDIKASNVLLDSSFESHIADFGLARCIQGSHSHFSTQVAGTLGYMPPEYINGSTMATMPGDVYSFGVLLLEAVTGRRPSLPFPGDDGKEVRLMEWINSMVEQSRYMEMVDSSIVKDEIKESTVVEIFNIGLKCANEKWKDRPTMKEVVEELDKIVA